MALPAMTTQIGRPSMRFFGSPENFLQDLA
jgi:hypothetical protein